MKKIMFNDRYGLTQAVLEGRKTVTRRELRGAPLLPTDAIEDVGLIGDEIQVIANGGESLISCRTRYKLCETVAVAQSYKDVGYAPNDLTEIIRNGDTVFIPFKEHKGWANKMFTRWDYMLYRIFITDIRVERLQDISDEGCLREGVTAGVADVLVLVPRGGYGALGLEFKTTARNSRQSPSQKAWQKAFEAAGNRYHVVRTIDEAIEATNDYMQNNDKNERKTLHKRHEQDLADGGRAARRAVAAAQSEN